MKKKKVEKLANPVTIEDLAKERRICAECQKPIKLGWAIYGFATLLYILNGIVTNFAVMNIPQELPITDTLKDYKQTEEYTDYIAETQRQATDKLTNGEISIDEYNYIIETLSSNEKFEEFLRLLEDDDVVKQTIAEYDTYAKKMDTAGKVYAGTSIASLSSLLIATLILAKYRFREMDIEDNRKKRAKELGIDLEQFEQ